MILDHPLKDLAALDAKGQATDEERAILREDVFAFDDAVAQLRRDLQSQFAQRNADADEYKNECLRLGYTGKAQWFEYKADLRRWKANAQRYLQGLEALAKQIAALKREHKKGTREQQRAKTYPILKDIQRYLVGEEVEREELLVRVTTLLVEQYNDSAAA
ncbi:MAG: hypothetical protein H0T57_11585 [Rubrobacter sp.]|nr:hypothetical protein [Rubrobacter sp.]